VCTTNEDRECVHRIADRYTFLHRYLVIDLDLVLRIVRTKEGEKTGKFFTFAQVFHKIPRYLVKLVIVTTVRFIEQLQCETTCRTETWYCRRIEELDGSSRNFFRFFFQLVDDLLHRMLTLRPWLQVDKTSTCVRSTTFR